MSASSPKGITLQQGTVVVLTFDGTLVYIEDLEPMWAAVLALPEQPDTRTASNVFIPGAVRGKKISPYASFDKVVPLDDLSDKNREFITHYAAWRQDRGANFVFGKVEAVPVKKVKPADVDDPTGASKPKRGAGLSRKEKRALARATNCATCGKQKADPVHDSRIADKYDHDFASAAPTKEATMPTGRGKPARPSNGARVFTLVSADLTTAKTQPKGERYDDGNRFHRVVMVLAALPDKSGTVEDIIAALLSDGGKIPANPEKVVKRCLAQLVQPAFGACVSST